MKKISFLLLLATTFGCNNTADKKSTNGQQDSAASTTATSTETTEPVQEPIEAVKGSKSDIPENIKMKGTLQEVWKWKDKLGENLLITTLVEPYSDKRVNEFGETGNTSELFAFHYTKTGEVPYKQLWMMTDGVTSCPFDITCDFIKNSIKVTDLDNDGTAETTLQYKLACRSDVSPSNMKLIMHEGVDKYALRGLMWYGMPETDFEVTADNANLETLPGYKKGGDDFVKEMGRYTSEKDFVSAPPPFLQYARKQWIYFIKE